MQTKEKENIYNILIQVFAIFSISSKYFWHSLTYTYLTKTIKKINTGCIYVCVYMYIYKYKKTISVCSRAGTLLFTPNHSIPTLQKWWKLKTSAFKIYYREMPLLQHQLVSNNVQNISKRKMLQKGNLAFHSSCSLTPPSLLSSMAVHSIHKYQPIFKRGGGRYQNRVISIKIYIYIEVFREKLGSFLYLLKNISFKFVLRDPPLLNNPNNDHL